MISLMKISKQKRGTYHHDICGNFGIYSIKSEHNVQIRDCLVREVSLAHSEKYKEADVAVAVKRKYESLRRTYKKKKEIMKS
uniref:Uncharacterized protein n=1 Tax=Amphimedon queenslandica TaxID=400682 RepID=A0A1X7UQG3_AMPQE